MESINHQERMREIEIFGIPALFTSQRVAHDAVYPGLFRYELESSDNALGHVAETATSGFLGTVLTPVAIPTDKQGQREIGPGDLVFDTGAGSYTPEEFEEKYLSPEYDEQQREARYGKAD